MKPVAGGAAFFRDDERQTPATSHMSQLEHISSLLAEPSDKTTVLTKTCLIFLVKKTNTNDDALTMHYSTKRDTQYVYLDSYLQIKALKKKPNS